MLYKKYFDSWNKTKKYINDKDDNFCVRKGEIRWAILGVNVGSEMDGKGRWFSRPVLILETASKSTVLVIPLASKHKNVSGRCILHWKNKQSSLCINQTRVISIKRINNRLGKISDLKLLNIKKQVVKFYNLKINKDFFDSRG